MDKSKVVSILAPYSPPLAPSQVEAIATEIVSASTEEATKVTAETPKPSRKKSRES